MREYLWVAHLPRPRPRAALDRTSQEPGPSTWANVIGEEPALILLDELPPYFVSLGEPAGWAAGLRRRTGWRSRSPT